MPARAAQPFTVPADVWQRQETITALRNRDVQTLLRVICRYGISQTQIGAAIGFSQGRVSATMNGTSKVTAFDVFERIADGLNMPDPARTAFGLAPRHPHTSTVEAHSNPSLSAQPQPTSSGLPSPEYLDNLSSTSSPPIIAGLRHVLAGHIQAEAIMGPTLLASAVGSQVPIVTRLCQVTRGADRAHALRFASELMEFYGWLHEDLGDFPSAMAWTSKGLDYAMELGDQRSMAYILMRKSAIATESGDHGHGISLANAALVNSSALTPRLRAVILRTRAIAYARLGEAADSARDSDTALMESTAGLTQHESDIASYCTPEFISMETGIAQVLLGNVAAAIPVFESSRTQWTESTQVRDHTLLLARTATAYAMADEPQHACEITEEAMIHLPAVRSHKVSSQVKMLRRHLTRWAHDPYVTDLLTRLDIYSASLAPASPQP